MELLFWVSAGFVLYVYAGYPLLLGVWAWIKGAGVIFRAPRNSSAEHDSRPYFELPGVSVIIAARNEAPRLPARIENLLAADYPQDRLQIIVASDGSTDATVDALAPYARRVELLMMPPGGKARTLNAAISRARHPILVFADARQRFAPDAIRRLVDHFIDPTVGAVSGELVLDCENDRRRTADRRKAARGRDRRIAASTIAAGVGAYWKYEKWLRRHEAIVGSTLGVTGAVYAMRRSLWTPLPADTILDDVLGPMRVVLKRYRVIFESRAQAFDITSSDASAETRRKVRTLAGNYQLIWQEPRLLVPLVNPVWLQFMSHKVGRLLVPYALVITFVTSAWLATSALVYGAAFAAQVLFYGLAVYGALLDHRERSAVAGAPEVIREAA
jgi:biofilm PGA synthesis N-glycosyltransferase PgaC